MKNDDVRVQAAMDRLCGLIPYGFLKCEANDCAEFLNIVSDYIEENIPKKEEK
jgi:hypothetical protein